LHFLTATLVLGGAISASAAGYTTYIGDANEYHVTAIAADADGNTYVTGSRSPVADVFVAKVDASGNPTLLATLSATGPLSSNGIAVDSSANIYIVGVTTSTDFPLLNPLQSVSAPGGTGFLVKLGPDGTPANYMPLLSIPPGTFMSQAGPSRRIIHTHRAYRQAPSRARQSREFPGPFSPRLPRPGTRFFTPEPSQPPITPAALAARAFSVQSPLPAPQSQWTQPAPHTSPETLTARE
jgi:hypothetical protein